MSSERSKHELRAPAEIQRAMDAASVAIDSSASKLSRLIQDFHEAHADEHGKITMGTGLQFEVALEDEKAAIYDLAISNEEKPPAADIREAKAHRAVMVKYPDLWADYHRQKAEIDALRTWISNAKAAISANQSLLRGERE